MPVNIQGRDYKTVAERLKEAHGTTHPRPDGIAAIRTNCELHGTVLVVKATVTFIDKREFTGHSLVDFQATGKAERDAPLETCETSAVGRALAMAGYPGSDAGLAGAEELAIANRRDEWRQRQPARPQNGGGYVSEPARR